MKLFILALFILVALALPVRFTIKGKLNGRRLDGSLDIQYAFWHIRRQWQHQMGEVSEKDVSPSIVLTTAKNENILPNWRLIMHDCQWLWHKYRKRITLEKLEVNLKAGLQQADVLGWLSGLLWGFFGAVNLHRQKKIVVNFEPVFTGERYFGAQTEGIISSTLGQIILSVVMLAVDAIRIYWQLHVKVGRRKVYE